MRVIRTRDAGEGLQFVAHLSESSMRPTVVVLALAESAHAALLVADIKRFLDRPATAVAVRMSAPQIPPGAPIGEPAMEWLRMIEAPCAWSVRW